MSRRRKRDIDKSQPANAVHMHSSNTAMESFDSCTLEMRGHTNMGHLIQSYLCRIRLTSNR